MLAQPELSRRHQASGVLQLGLQVQELPPQTPALQGGGKVKVTLRVMDLFSGIGGFSYGFKKAGGFRTVAYCEIDPYCQAVLLARMRDGWLDTAPIHNDITKLDGKPWRGRVDVVTGGFPCQDISNAGKRAGIDGDRSGLWRDMGRLVCEVRPRYVVVENVESLLDRGMGRVLGDLAALGYDTDWSVLSACSVGAPHMRERVFIVAHPSGERWWRERGWLRRPPVGDQERDLHKWRNEPPCPRVAHGLPNRLDRIGALGNSIVPQIAEWIGKRLTANPPKEAQ